MLDTRVPLHALLHPLTKAPIVPLGFRKNGRAIWPVLGGSEPPNRGGDPGGDGGGDPGPDGGDPPGGDPADGGPKPPTDVNDPHYFPPNTPVAEMTADQRANYWRFEAKKQQARLPKNLDDIVRRAGEYDALLAASRTEAEVAVDEAREAGRAEGRAQVLQDSADTILRAAIEARGKSEDETDAIMRGLNPAGFISNDNVDRAAIRAFVDTLIPDGAQQQQRGGGDIGQGRGRGSTGGSSVASGRERYRAQRERPGARSRT